jgi:hypothetical protein
LPARLRRRSAITAFAGSHAAHRLRNSHSRCARCSVPARILSMFERCV